MNELTATILIVEDDEDDVFALRRALRKAGIGNPQQVVRHGEAAVDYLSGNGKYADRSRFPLPFLVLLDLKTPFRHGFEVLSWIGERPALKSMVVVVLTGSVSEADDRRACSLGAHSYMMKPPSQSDLQQLVKSVQGSWVQSGAAVTAANAPRFQER